jgi:ubiquinone biosynthesis protein Coq4
MIDQEARRAFAAKVGSFDETPATVEEATDAAKTGDQAAVERVCVALARVAFATPEAIVPIYDAVARGWLGLAADALASPSPGGLDRREDVPAPLWAAFWGIVDDTRGTMSASEITARVAALADLLPPGFAARAEAAARAYPGAADAASRPVPPPLRLETLAALPDGSLGHDFWRLITENKFDLEVLDREAIGLQHLSPALRYLNTRILQMHDVWHLVGGYRTTALHEIAISAFQLAQFGHNYSAMFLATVTTATWCNVPLALGILLQTIAEAWRHGRTTPPFMAIPWEEEWHRPVAAIRERHGIVPFASLLPADLIETARR